MLYTAKTHTTGRREGESRSSDGRLAVKLSPLATGGSGTNPEQLFAAGWSACFEGATGLAARTQKVTLPHDTSIDAEVDPCLGNDGYSLRVRMNVSVPGVPRDVVQRIVNTAHETCPYSKATRGNIDVSF